MKELLRLFLKLGIIGFGGPAAHIVMMRNEVVVKRKWMTDDEFLQMIGVTNLIPGPNSTEMSIYLGKVRKGYKGLILSGVSFILPAVLITSFFAVLYVRYGNLPEVQPYIYGIKPAIVAIIFSAIYPLGKASYKTLFLFLLGLLCLIASLAGLHELVIMALGGVICLIFEILSGTLKSHNHDQFKKNPDNGIKNNVGLLSLFVASGPVSSITLSKLFFLFLKIGSILYGSGYVLFAFLKSDLVESGWLTMLQLNDAIAVGQMTPGPLFSSVTFIGYLLHGWEGAIVSTIGVFLPSFIFVALLSEFFNKLHDSPYFMSFMKGIIASSVALIAAVGITLVNTSIYDWKTTAIGLVAFTVLFVFKNLNNAFIVVGGAFAGYMLNFV